ncbi:DUF5129 domain-containing protein [Arthrobacter psychrochitiniphilus]|uniref:DUF5129 domain-containing protein n=1 Tax=Arthrobacter psychrochitiniphilus TaxID=291045 RepID=UPI003F7B6084
MKKTLGILLLALMTMVGVAPAAVAEAPASVVIEDTAGVLFEPQLVAALENINFRAPTKVVIFTRNGKKSDNFNEEVLRYARALHPDWLSADGQKFADGLFIFAFDPVGRQVGTYMGEDRKVSLSKRAAIQDSARDLFRDAQWTDGTITGVKKAAKLINQPWYQSTWFFISTGIAALFTTLGFGIRAAMRSKNRKKAAEHLKRGDAGFASVSLALETTELNAKTIPEASSYGALVLEKYRNFSARYNETSVLNQQSHAYSQKELSKKANVMIVCQYADLAQELDALDDVIGDTNTLLNRFSGWEGAWDRQIRPLRDDLHQLPTLVSQLEAQGLPSTLVLNSFGPQKLAELEQLGASFQEGRITPEAALDQLAHIREGLTALLQQHADAAIDKYAKTSSEKTAMRSSMDADRKEDFHRGQPTILGSVYGWNSFYSVVSFNSGYVSARQQVDTTRSNASAGGSTGYGSSGGSFSGSGSSSRF